MPTRKQRRRQAKERRHEYEYVYVDDEGKEVAGEDVPEESAAPAKPKAAKSPAKPAASASRGSAATGARPARKIDPPSWQRVFRRAAIFAPVMLLVVYYLGRNKNESIGQVILTTAILLFFFLPFSYWMDTVMYRQYRKRIGDPVPPRERKSRARR